MMRKLVIFLTAAMMVAMPLAANALGFGSIKLNSALDEPLDAQIELLSPTPDDISNLKIKLAPSSAFMRAGIDRPIFLEKLKFALKQDTNGSYYIHVTSKERVREPFLDFLLEMEWRNGRMVREYTMLLDPPGTTSKAPEVIEAPATVTPEQMAQQEQATPAETPFAAPETTPVPAPVAEAPAAASSEFVLAEGEQMPRIPLTESTEPEPVPESKPAAAPAPVPEPVPAPVEEQAVAPASAPAPEAEVVAITESATFEDDTELFPRIPLAAYGEKAPSEPRELGKLDYGIVKKGDTLWQIAEKIRPDDSVSIYQVMMALLKSNPDAFVDNNVNRLKVGHVLRIDDPSVLTAMSSQDARQEYQSQAAVWEEYRQQVAEHAATQPIVAGEVTTEQAVEPESGGELTLASPEGTDLQTGAGTSEEVVNDNIVALREELRQIREDTATAGVNNPELNARLQELDEELAQMQRSVSISDDELAALQQQLAQLQAQSEQPVSETVTETAVAETPEGAVEETGTEVAEAEPEQAAPAPGEEATSETEPPAEAVAEPESTGQSPVEIAEQIATQEPAAPAPAPEPPAAQPEEEGILGTILASVKSVGQVLQGMFGSSLVIFIGLPVLLVLIIIGLILLKRRGKTDKYQESILTGGPSSVTGAQEVKEAEEESSFLSDFAVSGAGAIQGDDSEVDPLTEADVFIAYGRYEAAEERLKEAIENDPGRHELKVKLLELYQTTKNKPAFENAAAEFYAALGQGASENPMWQKVAAMGAELVPGNPLFSGAQAKEMPDMASAADPGVGLSDSQVMDIGLDTGVFDTGDLGTTEKPEAGGDLDFNLDLEQTKVPETKEAAAEASPTGQEEDSGLDFNLDMGTDSSEAVSEELAEEQEDSSGLDFNLDMGSPAESAPTETAGNEPDLSMDLGGAVAEPEESQEELSDLDFNLETSDMPQPAISDEAGNEPDLDLSMSNISLADLEEVNTTDDTSEMKMDFDSMASEPSSQTMAIDMEKSAESEAAIRDIDEVGTKLDLAKAYIDMGDPDGARSILDEVMDEGDPEQKEEAQQLLQQIA
jgi:pilus assembly protein FimV